MIGISSEKDGDVFLLGHHDPQLPDYDADQLTISLRSAFRVGPRYQEPPGVSIDPREGAEDPWRMQKVRSFGMEDSEMLARSLFVDYELKKASLGLVVLGPGVPSLVQGAAAAAACADKRPERAIESAYRFWFCPRVPEGTRFVRDGDAVWIQRPVGAHVLTDEEFLDQKAHRVGARAAEGASVRFVQAVTELVDGGKLPQYAALRGDFRLLEAGKLIALVGATDSTLGYFLHEHAVKPAKIPEFVGGLWREESSEITCANSITETPISNGVSYGSDADVRKSRLRVTGGVEARVPISDHDLHSMPRELSPVLAKVRAARTPADAVVWNVSV